MLDQKVRLQDVKETIKNWLLSENYPEDFLRFFMRWTLLNLYYDELSVEKLEINRVLDFGRKRENLFDLVEDATAELVRTECVGEGRATKPPNSWVKTATLHLREVLLTNSENVCKSCRPDKRQQCQNVAQKSYAFGNMEALARVLYQIRCNLFHGDKTEYEDGFQVARNRFLVRIGNDITEIILRSISKS